MTMEEQCASFTFLRDKQYKSLDSENFDSLQSGSALEGLAITKPAPAPEAFAPWLPILPSTPFNATTLSEAIKLASELSISDSFWKTWDGKAKQYWANRLVAPMIRVKREREIILIDQKHISRVNKRLPTKISECYIYSYHAPT